MDRVAGDGTNWRSPAASGAVSSHGPLPLEDYRTTTSALDMVAPSAL